MCGEDADYGSIDAFVEDAIRTHMDIPDTEQELSIRLKGPTAAALQKLAETEGSDMNELLSKHINELVTKKA